MNRQTLRHDGYGVFVHQHNRIHSFPYPKLSIHLLKKGLEGSSYRISFKEKLSGRLNQLNGSDRCRETETKNYDTRAGYTGPVANVGPEPRTDMFGKNFQSLMPLR